MTNYTPEIKKEDLIIGKYYYGHCRNAHIARWIGDRFLYWRHKFGHDFIEEILCPEDEKRYDVFVAERPATQEEIDTLAEQLPLKY